jgi:hypothetical protein
MGCDAAFIVTNRNPLGGASDPRRGGARPDLSDRQLHARRRVHETLQARGGLSSPVGSCVWHVVGLQRSVREWAMRQGLGWEAGASGAGAGHPGRGVGDAGGAFRVWRGLAGLVKHASATLDGSSWIEAQKSAVATAIVARDPMQTSAIAHCNARVDLVAIVCLAGHSPRLYFAGHSWRAPCVAWL